MLYVEKITLKRFGKATFAEVVDRLEQCMCGVLGLNWTFIVSYLSLFPSNLLSVSTLPLLLSSKGISMPPKKDYN